MKFGLMCHVCQKKNTLECCPTTPKQADGAGVDGLTVTDRELLLLAVVYLLLRIPFLFSVPRCLCSGHTAL